MHTTQRLFRAAFGLTLANLIVTILNAVIGVVTARSLPAFEYGQVAFFMSIYLLATLLAGLGLTDQAMRDVAEHRALGQTGLLHQTFYTLLAVRLATAGVLVLVLCAYGLLLQQWTPVIIGVAAAFAMTFDFLTGVLRGLQRNSVLIGVLCLQPIVYLALIVLLAPATANQVLLLLCGSFGLATLATSAGLYGAGIGWPSTTAFSKTYIQRSTTGAAQLYLVALLQLAYSTIGTLMLGALGRYEGTGVLSVSLTITRMLPLMLGPTISSIYYPQLRISLAKQAHTQAAQAFDMFFATTLLIGIGGAALLAVFPDTAVQTLYTTKYIAAVPVVRLLTPLCVLLVIDMLLTWTLIAHNHALQAIKVLLGRVAMLAVCSGVATTLTPNHAVHGIAASYLIASGVGVVWLWTAARRSGTYNVIWQRIAVTTGAAFLVTLACRWCLPNLAWHNIGYLGNSVLAAVIYGCIAIVVYLRIQPQRDDDARCQQPAPLSL